MSDRDKSVIDRLRARGEEVFTQVSNELMMNPRFIQAMQTALKGKATVDVMVAEALKTMNLPTRTEFKRALSRVESLENDLRELREELRRTRAQAARASSAARTTPKPAAKSAAAKKAAPAKAKAGRTRPAAPRKKAAGDEPAATASTALTGNPTE